MWDSEALFVAKMVATGCAESIEMDEDGEPVITWNMKALKEKYPEVYEVIWQQHLEDIGKELGEMVDKGLLQMSFAETEDGGIEPTYSITELGREVLVDVVDTDT